MNFENEFSHLLTIAAPVSASMRAVIAQTGLRSLKIAKRLASQGKHDAAREYRIRSQHCLDLLETLAHGGARS